MNIPLKFDFSRFWTLPPCDVDRADVYETDLSARQVCRNTRVVFLGISCGFTANMHFMGLMYYVSMSIP